MKLSEFDYHLPKELIAQEPARPRSSSRLMVVKGRSVEHKIFTDVIGYFRKGDVLVLNETKVEPVKLVGKKETGSPVEMIISKKISSRTFECQIKTNKVKMGTKFLFNKGLEAKVASGEDGIFTVMFNKDDVDKMLDEVGQMPLPPYIKRPATKEEYQTVYAKKSGSIAAPTAGFHFTAELLAELEKLGVIIVKVLLHVSYGTFLPVKTENVEEHKMHEEWYEITKEAADAINDRTGRLVVVGTTSLRALESASDELGIVQAKSGMTCLYCYPGYKFRIKPDMMITNFHLPKSTLIMLISALIGLDNVKNAYDIAVKEKYRFYSFGDAMLFFTE
jgi:S-adenosylmethionine:tRNA ribosyltransferase-isomerase